VSRHCVLGRIGPAAFALTPSIVVLVPADRNDLHQGKAAFLRVTAISWNRVCPEWPRHQPTLPTAVETQTPKPNGIPSREALPEAVESADNAPEKPTNATGRFTSKSKS